MTISNTSLPDPLPGASRPRLRVNPAVIVGLGDFGGVALRRLSERLRAHHPALLEKSGWLRLTTSGWREPFGAETTTSGPYDAAPLHAPVNIAPAPLARALDEATSQATVGALQQAGYDPSASLDTIVVAHAGEALAREALWPLLDLLRAQPPLRENRLTLILACDSRRFSGPLAPELGRFFDQLSQRLIADRATPAPGAIHWCYLCDVLDMHSRLLGDDSKDAVQSQAELIEGFMTLLLASNLRRDRAYARTALPELAHDASAPPDAALVSSFSLGALVLPVDQIAALARDQLALRLHAAAFPSKSSVTDRDTGWSARERLLAAVDLSPQGLRARLLRGPDDAPLRFDTAPPDLSGMDQDTLLQGLARWRNGLQTRWDDENDSPSAQVARNADALLDKLRGQVRREVDGMLQDSPRGLHQALAFLDELPQAIGRAQVQLVADDSAFLQTAIPSADQKFRELGEVATNRHWNLWTIGLMWAIALTFFLLDGKLGWLSYLAGMGLMVASLAIVITWRRPRRFAQRQADFIAAVQLKFQSAQERQVRDRRRGILDKLSQAVRQERQALLGWRDTLAAARDVLAQAETPPFQAVCGERPLCDPAEYPSPIPAYDEEKIAAIAAHYLDPGTRPYRRDEQPQAIADWLRQGAERALAAWRESLTVSVWSGADAAQALGELAAVVQPQWPLAPRERRQTGLNVVGLLEQDERFLAGREELGRAVVVSTCDPVRLTYAPVYHGLRLKKLAAARPLWRALREAPPPGAGGALDTMHKTFVWRYSPAGEAQEHHVNLVLSRARYQALREKKRPPLGQWGPLVAMHAPSLDALVEALGALHQRQNWSRLEQAANVLAFTQQCIKYDSDLRTAPAGEWPRYPLETLLDGVGDCEDAVILAAALLKRLGYDVALLYYPGHCALGVAGAEGLPGDFVEAPQTGVRYFYGETTSDGWSLGQVPPEYREIELAGIEVVK